MERLVGVLAVLVLLNQGLLITGYLPDVEEYPFKNVIYNNSLTESFQCENESVWCLRKCCLENYSIKGKTCVWDESVQKILNENVDVAKGAEVNFTFITGMLSCRTYRMDAKTYSSDSFRIEPDGKLLQTERDYIMNLSSYCVEYFDDIGISALGCMVGVFSEKQSLQMLTIGMIISMPFLLLTFVVYALLPERNIHGKCLMSYVITLFGAYVLLVVIQLNYETLKDGACRYLGLTCLFFFMVSFFWMNVMSIDIWRTFSGMRGLSGSKRQSEQRKFLLYSAYAWGAPILLVILVASLTLSKNIPLTAWYNPGMGEGQCWFKEGIATFIYFYLPMGIIIIANVVFFIITAYKIKQVQRDTSMLRKNESKKHSLENDKQRFNLYLKLLLAMGINWIMEIISWGVNWQVKDAPKAIWYLTDFCNALYGVFIFFIFVFKRNIWKMLKRRYYNFIGKPHLGRTMTQTGYSSRTRGSSLNQTVTSDCKSYVDDTSITLTSQVA